MYAALNFSAGLGAEIIKKNSVKPSLSVYLLLYVFFVFVCVRMQSVCVGLRVYVCVFVLE